MNDHTCMVGQGLRVLASTQILDPIVPTCGTLQLFKIWCLRFLSVKWNTHKVVVNLN